MADRDDQLNYHQGEIARWHAETFPNISPLQQAKKVLEEASDLHCAVKENSLVGGDILNPSHAVVQEIADVMIATLALGSMYGINLSALVLERLEELKLRTNQGERDKERGIA